MFQMYFLVKDEYELRDKVWENFFEKVAGGASLRIQELTVDGSHKRLFRVWTTVASSYTITTNPGVINVPLQKKNWWETTLTC